MNTALVICLIGLAVYLIAYFAEGSKLGGWFKPFSAPALYAFAVGLLAYLLGK